MLSSRPGARVGEVVAVKNLAPLGSQCSPEEMRQLRPMLVTTLALSLLCGASAFAWGSVAFATPSDRTRGPGARALSHASRSTGFPWDGRLRRGVLLHESANLRYTTEYRAGGNFWGIWELVQLLERAAYRVNQRMPGAKLSVGELSQERGGRVPGHASHRSGRDADIAFYMLDARDQPYEPFGFAAFGANGRGRGVNSNLHFDDARNWELVAKLVADGDARVQYIFVSNALKQRVLREGRRRHASAAILNRAEAVLIQPSGANRHENHFHVRVYCPPASRPACRDRAPFHAWYPGRPPR